MTQTLVPIGPNTRQDIANQLGAIQPTGMTLMSYSIQQAVTNDFIGKPGRHTVVLVSDGRETCASNPCDVALAMVRSGVKVTISTIGLGLNDPVAQDQLKCVALSTKGKFYEANTSAQLAKGLMDSFKSQASVSGRLFTGP
jgi:Ca-activated chloride channel family protein